MKGYKKYIALSLVLIPLLLILFFKISGNKWKETVLPYILESSIRESIIKKTFIDSVQIKTSNILVDHDNIKISECWVQQTFRVYYKYVFFKKVESSQKYFLCFTMNDPEIFNKTDFNVEFNANGIERFSSLYGSNGKDVYGHRIETLNRDTLKGIIWIDRKPTDDTLCFILSKKILEKIYER